jgi:hypothetical protein
MEIGPLHTGLDLLVRCWDFDLDHVFSLLYQSPVTFVEIRAALKEAEEPIAVRGQ